MGIDFGADGVRSPDDITYGSWNPALGSTKVNEVIYSGIAIAYDATNVGLEYVQDYVNGAGPFGLTVTYTLDGVSSSQTRTVVPEPASLTLLLGGSLLALIRRRSAKRS
jgi:hypothetical protein